MPANRETGRSFVRMSSRRVETIPASGVILPPVLDAFRTGAARFRVVFKAFAPLAEANVCCFFAFHFTLNQR